MKYRAERALLKNGANVETTDKEEVSVLYFAALNSNYLNETYFALNEI